MAAIVYLNRDHHGLFVLYSFCSRFLNSISNMYMERSQFDDFLRKGAYGKMAMKAQLADIRHPQPGPSGLSRPRRGSRPRSGREMTDVQTD